MKILLLNWGLSVKIRRLNTTIVPFHLKKFCLPVVEIDAISSYVSTAYQRGVNIYVSASVTL